MKSILKEMMSAPIVVKEQSCSNPCPNDASSFWGSHLAFADDTKQLQDPSSNHLQENPSEEGRDLENSLAMLPDSQQVVQRDDDAEQNDTATLVDRSCTTNDLKRQL